MSDSSINAGLEDVVVAATRLSAIDGENGELLICGFPLEELAGNASYEESAYLLLNDRLPTATELAEFHDELVAHRQIGSDVTAVLRQAAVNDLPAMDALRMGAATANLGTTDESTESAVRRLIAVFPTIVATYWRYRHGNEVPAPRDDLGHAANYLYMVTGEEPSDEAVRGLETYLNTVIDHGVNASTFTARVVMSTESDVVSAATAAVGALKGPLHGGAPGPVLDMLFEINESGSPENYIRETLASGDRLMGFGHRVYRVRDPRAVVLAAAAERFFDRSGNQAFFEMVETVEGIAVDMLAEEHPDRRLRTNVEYYTAALLYGVGIPKELFTATFGVSRIGGWMAHALEQLVDNRIVRPRSRYVGAAGRTWTPLDERERD